MKTIALLISTGAAVLALTACTQTAPPSPPEKSQPVTDAVAAPNAGEAHANFERWKAALATKDPKQVAALFAANAVLEPTVSNEIRNTPAEIEAYFVDFLKLSPTPTINERHVVAIDENTLLDAGIWTFDLIRNGKLEWVAARYSFVWEKADDQWKIQLLHSSVLPEPVTTRPAPLQAG